MPHSVSSVFSEPGDFEFNWETALRWRGTDLLQ